ncbi:MAG: ParB/RepB/Spo0J family partition protein [Thermodesulfobacteriota bacterium]
MPKATETGTRRTALGLGLDALIPLNEPAESPRSDAGHVFLPVDHLIPNPFQPRSSFDEQALTELSESIREMGVIQPLIVRPTQTGSYEIVAGERRWRAARMAGYSTVPVIIRNVSDSEALETALIENLQREDLNPLDTAEAYETLISRFSYTHEALAKRIGKDRSNITNYVRLLKLPDPIKEDVRKNVLSMGHARTLLSVESVSTQLRLSRQTVRRRLSVRELEKIVQNFKQKEQHHKTKDVTDRPHVSGLEKGLSRLLSTKVVVRENANESGRLEIHFHSREELERLLALLGYTEDFS